MRRNHGFLEIAFPTFVPIGEQELKPVSRSPSHVYTADDNDTSSNEVPSTEEIRVAQNGYHLLSSWTTAPDILEDDSFDPELLHSWVSRAMGQLGESGRRAVGEIHLGHVLSRVPPDIDGQWPNAVVREILEELQSERIERGFEEAVLNDRGGNHPIA